jgi:hypothetical protein
MLAAGTSGYLLQSNGTSAPSWTPAPASAGAVTAVATGSLPNGSTVILNSDGTVSVPVATGTDTITTVATGLPTSSSAVNTNVRSISAVYGSKDNIIVIFYIGPSTYLYSIAGSVNGATITFGTPSVVNSSNGCAADPQYGVSAAYDYINNQYFCLYRWNATGYGAYVQVTYSSALTLSNSYNNSYGFATSNIYPTGYSLIISPTANGSFTQGLLIWHSNSSSQVYVAGVSVTSSSPYLSIGGETFVINSGGSYQMTPTFCDVSSKALVVYRHPSGYPTLSVITLSGTSATANTAVQINTDNASGAPVVASYSVKQNKYFVAWANSTSAVKGCVVTVSGTTPTVGTIATISGFSTGTGNYLYSCPVNEITGDFWYCNGIYAARITVSGTTFTSGSIQTFPYSEFPSQAGNLFYDSANYTLVLPSVGTASAYKQQLSFASAYTSTLKANNFIGFSSAAYTNGQTATINTVGSTNSGVSGLTTASGYYVSPDGLLTTSTTSNYAGVALSATKILVKG